MTFRGASILGFLLILLIIQKSKAQGLEIDMQLIAVHRIAIVAIRNLGQSPCPRCLVKKKDIFLLGTPEDMACRTCHARSDDDSRRRKVSSARDIVYKQGFAIDSKHVDKILKEDSFILTEVCPRSGGA